MQLSLFDGSKPFKIDKPVRLISLFSGYDSQALALKYLGVNFEHWKTCEWAVKSIQALKDIHFAEDNTDYSKGLDYIDIINFLEDKGISIDYNKPMTRRQIYHLGEQRRKQIFNNIKATHNLVNIQKAHAEDFEIIETDKYCYIMTYSFPCQDLSKAGKGAGMEKGGGTRSGMLWEVERLLDEMACGGGQTPQVLLMENVPDVIGTKNIKHFAKWLEKLESLGYHCYWQVLNGKDYGVPQNRERCFMVSIRGDYYYDFPPPIKLDKALKNLLEDEVDEKYYISDSFLKYICADNEKWTGNNGNSSCINKSIASTITTREGNVRADCSNYISKELPQDYSTKLINENQNLKKQLCNDLITSGKVKENDVIRHSYSSSRMDGQMKDIQQNNMCPTLDTRCDCLGVCVKEATKQGYAVAYDGDSINLKHLNSKTRRGRVGKQKAQTLTTDCSQAVVNNYRIRKLTPRECGRLMAVKDEDINKLLKNQSNASLYHIFGDSIVCTCLMALFGNMLGLDWRKFLW